jgi:hypothetical protein
MPLTGRQAQFRVADFRVNTMTNRTISFRAKIEILGINPFVYVGAKRAEAIHRGWRKPLPVMVRVNGKPEMKPWRINMMPIGGGDFRLYLHGDVRRASKTKVGDSVRIQVQFDAAYRNGPLHQIPSWFQVSLEKNAKANKTWNLLIPSRRKEILRYFSRLKSPEARERNLERAMHVLSGHSGRFMARSW